MENWNKQEVSQKDKVKKITCWVGFMLVCYAFFFYMIKWTPMRYFNLFAICYIVTTELACLSTLIGVKLFSWVTDEFYKFWVNFENDCKEYIDMVR